MSISVLVDASNLHSGGGVQVASSFLEELAELKRGRDDAVEWIDTLEVEVSQAVRDNLSRVCTATLNIATVNRRSALQRAMRSLLARPKHTIVFTVFGARYGRRRGKFNVTGCADVTSFYQYEIPPPGENQVGRLKRRLRGALARWSFRRDDILITEAAALRNRMLELGFDADRVLVVPNVCHPVFDASSTWQTVETPQRELRELRFIYVAAHYHHKNFEFLPALFVELQARLGRPVRCLVTLDDSAWERMSTEFKRFSLNVGKVSIHQLPLLYRDADAALFPSLLESFSATPLEAMKMGLPLFASDRDFVKSVCGNGAIYFDPRDQVSAASVISDSIMDESVLAASREAAAVVVQELTNSRQRCLSYLEILSRGTLKV